MQTFLPYPMFSESALVLDTKRLGKQRVECLQIYRSLTLEKYGWKNHPAVRMWRGYENALLVYFRRIMIEWMRRGYSSGDNLNELLERSLEIENKTEMPFWLGNFEFHLSHQSNLVRKDPIYYRRFFPDVKDDLPYVWPV